MWAPHINRERLYRKKSYYSSGSRVEGGGWVVVNLSIRTTTIKSRHGPLISAEGVEEKETRNIQSTSTFLPCYTSTIIVSMCVCVYVTMNREEQQKNRSIGGMGRKRRLRILARVGWWSRNRAEEEREKGWGEMATTFLAWDIQLTTTFSTISIDDTNTLNVGWRRNPQQPHHPPPPPTPRWEFALLDALLSNVNH